jgi:ribonuclease HI
MDMSYATVPIFGGEFRRIYRETKLAYIVSDHQDPTNHPIYAKDKEIGSSILHLTDESDSSTSEILKQQIDEGIHEQNSISNKLWKVYFDGSSSREGSGAGVVLISPTDQVITLSFKLQFLTTNNTTEYEALILGMKAAKDLGVGQLTVFGDAELGMQQVKKIYQVKEHKLKNYKNEVWDLVEHYFFSFNISYISREMNKLADSLAVATSSFKVPLEPKD